MLGGHDDDGLLQRFQLMVYPDVSKDWRNIDRYADRAHGSRAFEIFRKLDGMNVSQLGVNIIEETGHIPFLHFDEQGQDCFDSWRSDLEAQMRGNRLEHPALEAHLSKYRSLMPSLALLFHLIDKIDGKADVAGVSSDATRKAVEWCSYLFAHARRIYGLAAAGTTSQARAIIEKIRTGALKDTFTARDVYRNQWAGLTSAREVVDPLALLEDFGWLRSVPMKSSNEGGRPTTNYLAHPKIREGGR